jgi:hypothetical protein
MNDFIKTLLSHREAVAAHRNAIATNGDRAFWAESVRFWAGMARYRLTVYHLKMGCNVQLR